MKGDRIVLAHGGGGQLTDELVRTVILPRLGNPVLNRLEDSAVLPALDGELVFTTDGYVVKPLEFPGGDIGRLAVCGTVNDLAVCGAVPLHLSLSLVIEEGLAVSILERVLDSAAAAAAEARVRVVTGDTKVVGRGQADGLFVTTAGIGRLRPGMVLSPRSISPGDRLLVSGPIGDHGLAVMLAREEAGGLRSDIESDCAPLAGLVAELLRAVPGTRFMRDATRGGLAGLAADLAAGSGRRISIEETALPMRPETKYAAEMLGLDPLSIANEGVLVAVVGPEEADAALCAMRAHPLGRRAAIAGAVEEDTDGLVELRTSVGGRRVVRKPYGEELPRIC